MHHERVNEKTNKLLKERLTGGELVVGSFIYVPSAELTEIISLSGFDFVVIDMEHGPIESGTAVNMVRAAEIAGAVPLIRVACNSPYLILRALDLGAHGVHVPNINTREGGEAAVANAMYGPAGNRGLAGVRAAQYGFGESLSEYAKAANHRTLVVVHIEDKTAIENLDTLLNIEGIDVYYLGPTDLSNSLGIPGRVTDDIVVNMVNKAIKRIVAQDRIAGCIASDIDAAKRYVDLGVRYLACHAMKRMVDGCRSFMEEVRK